jgi:predicted nucleic acid-binding protein
VSRRFEVLLRPRIAEDIVRLYVGRLQRLFVGAELVVIGYRDPKDDKFQLGVNGRADVILSGDTELLVLEAFRDIPTLGAAVFAHAQAF